MADEDVVCVLGLCKWANDFGGDSVQRRLSVRVWSGIGVLNSSSMQSQLISKLHRYYSIMIHPTPLSTPAFELDTIKGLCAYNSPRYRCQDHSGDILWLLPIWRCNALVP